MHRERINKSSLPLFYMEKAIVTFLNPDTGDKVIFNFKFDKEADTLDYDPIFKVKDPKANNNLIKTLSSVFIDALHGGENTTTNNSGESSIRDSNSK